MSFDTLPFALFLAATLFVWRYSRWPGYILLAASIAFYWVAGVRDLALVFAVVALNYIFSCYVARSKLAVISIICINIASLVMFKYRYFVFGSVDSSDFFTSQILIPLGISFYTFQITAYQIDVRRGDCAVQRNFFKFMLFVLFFPQLIAGPIVRSHQLMPQVERLFEGRRINFSAPSLALGLICLGVFKKVFIADSLSPHVDAIFAGGPADAYTAWLGAWLFTFQIYYDFSGYSDMAVGMARLFGIRLPYNFRQPYLSKTPREFWQRWHITLSSWIRDYLYIPLGGSRIGGHMRQLSVMFLVMGLAGLWHGANWTFIVWGLAWSAVIIIWRLLEPRAGGLSLAGWAYTYFATVFLWVIFRSPDISFAGNYFTTMFGAGASGSTSYFVGGGQELLVGIGCCILLGLHWVERQLFNHRIARALVQSSGPMTWGILIGLSAWLTIMPKLTQNPFIYFRF